MATYAVTVVENVYETYLVGAASVKEAEAKVRDTSQRAKFPSYPDGGNDDVEIINVQEVPA